MKMKNFFVIVCVLLLFTGCNSVAKMEEPSMKIEEKSIPTEINEITNNDSSYEVSIEIENIPLKKQKNPITSEIREEETEKTSWEIDIEADAVLENGKIVFRTVIVTNEPLNEFGWYSLIRADAFFDKYETYVKFVDYEKDDGYLIAILPYVKLYDFQWLEIGPDFDKWEYVKKNSLFSAGDLHQGTPFVATYQTMGSFSHRGISFVGEYGERKYFAIDLNMGPEERPSTFIILPFGAN